ncbi:MAG: UDP-N-acetylglucosamine 2-epimerase [Weeksellaceae bacterium]
MRKVCIVTGTRAEFGLLRPLIEKIEKDKDFQLQLVATGMHLSPEFGNTINEIEEKGYKVDKKVECLVSSDSAVGVSKSMALALSGFADVYEDLQPNLLIVLGDRTEILAAVLAAAVANIPIAHIHGGETTEGAYDEAIRHSITKFSHLHFTSTETYRKRVIQLGENPDTVFNVGAIGLDSIKNLKLLNKSEFEESINASLKKKNILLTYHPVTLEKGSPAFIFNNILKAVDNLENTLIIFTHANSDKNGRVINNMIHEYVQKNPGKAIEFKSLGQLRYLSALQYVDMVIGNSSSGIVEVPYFKIPTINIGDRQKGRVNNESVIHTTNEYNGITKAINLAFDINFRNKILSQQSLYGEGTASQQIIDVIKSYKTINLKKRFYDL